MLLIDNSSSTLWIYLIHLAIFIFIYGPIWVINKKCAGRLSVTKKKMSEYFCCNGLIRLFMETAFELALVAVLNMHTVDWDTSFKAVKYSTSLSIITLIFLGGVPLFLTLFYCKYFTLLKQKTFREKYGAGIEGSKINVKLPKKSILGSILIFFGRRILFAASAVYLGGFLWA